MLKGEREGSGKDRIGVGGKGNSDKRRGKEREVHELKCLLYKQ